MLPIIFATGKPVVVALMGEKMIQEAVEHFRAAKVPEYRFPERAAAALAILSRQAESLQTAQDEPERPLPSATIRAQQILADDNTKPGAFLPTAVCQNLLTAYGIPVPGSGLATTADGAVTIARQVGTAGGPQNCLGRRAAQVGCGWGTAECARGNGWCRRLQQDDDGGANGRAERKTRWRAGSANDPRRAGGDCGRGARSAVWPGADVWLWRGGGGGVERRRLCPGPGDAGGSQIAASQHLGGA